MLKALERLPTNILKQNTKIPLASHTRNIDVFYWETKMVYTIPLYDPREESVFKGNTLELSVLTFENKHFFAFKKNIIDLNPDTELIIEKPQLK